MFRPKISNLLMKTWLIIQNNSGRYNTEDLAVLHGVNFKTICREIESMGFKLQVPTYQDNTHIMTLRVTEFIKFTRWLLGWGFYVEVLQPVCLRKEVVMNPRRMLSIYDKS